MINVTVESSDADIMAYARVNAWQGCNRYCVVLGGEYTDSPLVATVHFSENRVERKTIRIAPIYGRP